MRPMASAADKWIPMVMPARANNWRPALKPNFVRCGWRDEDRVSTFSLLKRGQITVHQRPIPPVWELPAQRNETTARPCR